MNCEQLIKDYSKQVYNNEKYCDNSNQNSYYKCNDPIYKKGLSTNNNEFKILEI